MNAFAERRNAFMDKMDPYAVAIFPSKPEYIRNHDVEYDYRQESNFYYLSGFEEPGSILLLAPANTRHKFVMFVRKRDPKSETFEGPRTGIDGAMEHFGADTSLYSEDFELAVYQFVRREGMLYYPSGVNPEIDDEVQRRFSGKNWHISSPYPILSEMRVVKHESDWNMGLRRAIDISTQAHLEAMRSVRPNMYEYEIQSVFEHVFRKNGSPRNAYPCIVGSGPNCCILHYNKNNRQMNAGELLMMDCAAEYGYYAADIARTVPVNGIFSKNQRAIYQIVLDAQNSALKILRPGIDLRTVNTVIDSVLCNGLAQLRFIKDKKDFRLFTLHGYTHWIGLDVHDVGEYMKNGESRILAAGMVFAIEPGIYVRPDIFARLKEKGYSDYELNELRPIMEPYLNIGVRIEDDVVITPEGFTNLSAGTPREIDEIEKLMRGQ